MEGRQVGIESPADSTAFLCVCSIARKLLGDWSKQVAAAIQRGDEPPGIRVVEDRLSADAPSLEVSSQPSPPKPWEVLGVQSSAHEDVEGGTGAGVVVGNAGGRGYGGREEGRSRPQHAVSVGP